MYSLQGSNAPFCNPLEVIGGGGGAGSHSAFAFDRLHPNILERVYCALFPPRSLARAAATTTAGGNAYDINNSSANAVGAGGRAPSNVDDASWTSVVVGCFLGVEVLLEKGGREDAVAVALVVTSSQLIVVSIEDSTNTTTTMGGNGEVGHAVPLHIGGLKEVIVERIHYQHQNNSNNSNSDLSNSGADAGQAQQASLAAPLSSSSSSPRILHTMCLKYQRNPLRATPMIPLYVQFPSSHEFDGFLFTLGSVMATMYPHYGVGIQWIEGDTDSLGGSGGGGNGVSSSAVGLRGGGNFPPNHATTPAAALTAGVVGGGASSLSSSSAIATAFSALNISQQLSLLANISAIPGALLASSSASSPYYSSASASHFSNNQQLQQHGSSLPSVALRRRSTCKASDILTAEAMLPWSAADRSSAQIGGGVLGAFYSNAHGSNDATSVDDASLAANRASMVGPALAVTVTDDAVHRARKHLDAVEASVLLSYERLAKDVNGAIGHVRSVSVRCAESRLYTIQQLYEKERRRQHETIIPLERDLEDAVKTLALRQKEHSDSQGDSFRELSQWNQLEQHSRRIEVQRLQSVKDAQQRNINAIEEAKARNVRLNDTLWEIREGIAVFESGSYRSKVSKRDALMGQLEEENRALRRAEEAFKKAKSATTRAERELSSTLKALRKTIREAEEDSRVATAKGEQLLSEATAVAKDQLHQQALIEKELLRRLEEVEGSAEVAALDVNELLAAKQELEAMLSQAKLSQQRTIGGGGDDGAEGGNHDYDYHSTFDEYDDLLRDDFGLGGGRGGGNAAASSTPAARRKLSTTTATTTTSTSTPNHHNLHSPNGALRGNNTRSAPFFTSASSTAPSAVDEDGVIVRGNRSRWDLSHIPRAKTAGVGASSSLATPQRNASNATNNNTHGSRSPLPSVASPPLLAKRDATLFASSSQSPASSRVMMGGGFSSPQQDRVSSGAMFLVERAKADEAAAVRVRSEQDAHKQMEARLQAVRDQLQRAAAARR